MNDETFPSSFTPERGTPELVRLVTGGVLVVLASIIICSTGALQPSPSRITPVVVLFATASMLAVAGAVALTWWFFWQEYQVHRRLVAIRRQWYEYAAVAVLVATALRNGARIELVNDNNSKPQIRFSAAKATQGYGHGKTWMFAPGTVIVVRVKNANDRMAECLKQWAA